MATKQSGGKITGLLALTIEAQEAINRGDAIHVIGDYEGEKADGTRPVLGYASVVNRGRVGDIYGTSVNNAIVPGDITVEARGFMVREVVAGGPIDAGREVAVGSDSKHYVASGGGAVTNEVQTVTEGGSGMTSFVLNHATWSGATSSLDDDATAATVQTAVDLVAGEGNVIVGGGPLGSAALTFEFVGANAGENVAAITATPTGGTGTLTVATSPAGASTTLATVGIALTSAEAEGDLIDVLVR